MEGLFHWGKDQRKNASRLPFDKGKGERRGRIVKLRVEIIFIGRKLENGGKSRRAK